MRFAPSWRPVRSAGAVSTRSRADTRRAGTILGLSKGKMGWLNSADSIQTVPLWNTSGPGEPPVTATFTLPQYTTVDFSRLYIDLWVEIPTPPPR